MVKEVPLTVLRNGEKVVVGTALVEPDGTVLNMDVTDPELAKMISCVTTNPVEDVLNGYVPRTFRR